MKALLIPALALGSLVFGNQEAYADKTVHIAGATCVPSETSISKYATSNGAMGFASGQTGVIHFHCAIPHPEAMDLSIATHALDMTYASSVVNSTNYVAVELYKLSKSNGSLYWIAGGDSTASGCGTSTGKPCGFTFSGDRLNDSANYYYFIAVHIARSSTSNTETFVGAWIDTPIQ